MHSKSSKLQPTSNKPPKLKNKRQISSSLHSPQTLRRPPSLPSTEQLSHLSPSFNNLSSSSNESSSFPTKSMITPQRRVNIQSTSASSNSSSTQFSSTASSASPFGLTSNSKLLPFGVDSIDSDSSGSLSGGLHSDSPFNIQSIRSIHAEINTPPHSTRAKKLSHQKQTNDFAHKRNNPTVPLSFSELYPQLSDTSMNQHQNNLQSTPSIPLSSSAKKNQQKVQFFDTNPNSPFQSTQIDQLLDDNSTQQSSILDSIHASNPTTDPSHPLHSSSSRNRLNSHRRPRLKRLMHQLSSYSRKPNPDDDNNSRHSQNATGSLNDEAILLNPHKIHIKRAKDLDSVTDIDQTDDADSNQPYYSFIDESNTQIESQESNNDTLLPDPSQLTHHVLPPLLKSAINDVTNESNDIPRAKYHPRLQQQLDLDKHSQESVSSEVKSAEKQYKMFKRRKKGPQAGTLNEISSQNQQTTDISDNVHENDSNKQHSDEEIATPPSILPPGACTMEEAMECVVKIFVTQSLPNFLQPWQKRPSTDHMGSGFLVKGKRIITNAHVVSDALVVMVRRPGSSRKFIARVVASAHECDLAVLEVEEDDFWSFGAIAAIDFENGQISRGYDDDGNEILHGHNDVTSYDEDTSNEQDNSDDPTESDEIINNMTPSLKPAQSASLKVSNDVKKYIKEIGQNDRSLSTNALRQKITEQENMSKNSHNSSVSSPDLPGVGPGSVGAPWWTLLAPDIANTRDSHQNKHKKTFLSSQPETPNSVVPVFSTHDEFKKEPGCLYITPAMPLLQSSVVVVGYPLGGDNCCITQGVVSRIEPTTYAHSGTYLLAIQIDAAINPGNSGGPALSTDGRVIGVAFQNITNASNVGYIIPAPVIIHFLRDVQSGAYRINDNSRNKSASRGLRKIQALGNENLFQQDQFSSDITKVQRPDTTVGTDQRFFTPYLTGFPSIGLFCQETTSESLRDYIGLSSCVKLTPLDDTTGNIQQQRRIQGGVRVRDALVELKHHKAMLNLQSIDTPGQSLLRRQMLARTQAMLRKNQQDNESNSNQHQTLDDADNFTLYNFETTMVPAAYSHYHVLEEHIKEDVRRKRQLPKIAHGLDQVGKSTENLTIPLSSLEGNDISNTTSVSLYKKQTISGVLISEISSLSAFNKLVFPGDVLLAVDGHELGADGSVHFRGHERIAFDHITSLKHNKQTIQLTILRKKKIQDPSRKLSLTSSADDPNVTRSYNNVFGQNNTSYGNNNSGNSSKGHITIHSMDTDQIHFQQKKDEFIATQNPSKISLLFDDPKSTIILDNNDSDNDNYHVHYDDGIQYKDKHKHEQSLLQKNSKTTAISSHSSTDTSNAHNFDVSNDIPLCIPVKQEKKIKLKIQNKKQYKHRIVAPCDDCSTDLQLPPYNATYYQNISEPTTIHSTTTHTSTHVRGKTKSKSTLNKVIESTSAPSPSIPQSLQDQFKKWMLTHTQANDKNDKKDKNDKTNDENDENDDNFKNEEKRVQKAFQKRTNKLLSNVWSTSLGILPDYIYTKQNNPLVKQQLTQIMQSQKLQHSLHHHPHHSHHNQPSNTKFLPNSNKLDNSTPITPPSTALQTYDDFATILPNSITSPSIHFTRLPFNYSHAQNSTTSSPSSMSKSKKEGMNDHILCVADDYELMTISAPVSILPSSSPNVYDRGSSYVFFGGLLFVPLSYQYTTSVGNDAPIHLTLARCAPLSTHDEEKVVLAQVLQDNDTVGYPYLDRPITHICGIPIHNLKGLLEVIQTKTIVAATSNYIKNLLSTNPTDLPLLLHLLEQHGGHSAEHTRDVSATTSSNPASSSNSLSIPPHIMIDTSSGSRYVYTVTKDSEERCKQIFNVLCYLSDLLCSETDVQSYTTSLINIYSLLPQQSLYKQYLQQVVHMYSTLGGNNAFNSSAMSPEMMGGANSTHQFNILPHTTPINTSSFDTTIPSLNNQSTLSPPLNNNNDQTMMNKSTINGKEQVRKVFIASHIHKSHSTPTTQAILALFDEDIRIFSPSSLPHSYYTSTSTTTGINSNDNNNNDITGHHNNDPIELLSFKHHSITVQTSENKLITLDMHRAVHAHFRLKDTLNI